MPDLQEREHVSLRRPVLFAFLVVLAGCTGVAPSERPTQGATDATTPVDTVEPHTNQGTAHISSHLFVRAGANAENVSVTLAPDGEAATSEIEPGSEHSFTGEIHERGHDVRVVVERGDETVFDREIQGYQSFQLTVYENETSRTQSVV